MENIAPKSSSPANRKPIGTRQFSLRALILMLALVGIILGISVYYRPHSLNVTYQLFTAKRDLVDRVVSGKSVTQVENSVYQCVVLNQRELDVFSKTDFQEGEDLSGKSRVITGWPRVADTDSYVHPTNLPMDGNSNHTAIGWESGTMTGFLGSRRAGSHAEVRIEYQVTFRRPGSRDIFDPSVPQQVCQGNIFYEGEVPDGRIVFFAPLDDETYHVIVFVVE